MVQSAGRILSIVEAARVIYRTPSPSDDQVRRVYQRMKAGVLRVHQRGGSALQWTTTEEALAEYLAVHSLHAHDLPAETAASAAEGEVERRRTSAVKEADVRELRGLYQGLYRDFFLAVLLRRRAAHRSAFFRKAVVAAQVSVLVVLAGLMFGGVRMSYKPLPPECKAVERYLAEHTDHYRIIRWHPVEPALDGNGVVLRVEYAYRHESPRAIDTDRRFRIVGDDVSELTESELDAVRPPK